MSEEFEARIIGQEMTHQADTILVAIKSQIVVLHNRSCEADTDLETQIAIADCVCRLAVAYSRIRNL